MKNENVSKDELVKELEDELAYHLDGGTKYRQDTTRYSLAIAKSMPGTDLFFDREQTLAKVKDLHPDMDVDRLQDVSKMLNVIVRDIHSKKNLDEDTKRYVEEKIKNFKGITFK